jgi:two-component system, LuxR family, response regulator FixJ
MQVYLVDDEEAIRRSLGVMLKLAGYACTGFASGAELLARVEGLAPGSILLDVRMPEMDGLEVQRQLNLRGVTMPVVFMTGHGDVAVAVSALRAGASDFLEKPFERATLLAALDRARLKRTDPQGYRALRDEAARAIARLAVGERAVLTALGQGLSNRAAADALALDVAAVETTRAALIEKLGGRTLADAIRLAHLAGIIADP